MSCIHKQCEMSSLIYDITHDILSNIIFLFFYRKHFSGAGSRDPPVVCRDRERDQRRRGLLERHPHGLQHPVRPGRPLRRTPENLHGNVV